jgi:hypothetical protein
MLGKMELGKEAETASKMQALRVPNFCLKNELI